MAIKKYSELCPKEAAPDLIFTLPELQYPTRLNAVRMIFDGARTAGWLDNPAFYSNGETITYAGLADEVHRMASVLKELGVAPDDRVLIRIPDTPALVFAILAVQALGAVAVPTYVQLRANDLIYRVEDAEASLIIADADLLDEVAPVADACPGVRDVLVTPRDPSGRFASYDDLAREADATPDFHDTHAEDLCLLLYTSGSTGEPKGTAHCHRDMLAICDTYWRYCIAPTPADVIAGPPSIAFALGFGMFVYFPLRFGHAAVLQPDKSPETALADIESYGVTIFAGVVSYYNALGRLIRENGGDLSTVRRAMTGGEPLTEETERAWLETTGLPLEQFIGTTEMLHCYVTSTHPTDPPRPSTLGRSVPGYEVAIIDPETHKPVPRGEQGLMAVRGPTGTVYWNKPDRQAETVIDGWSIFQDLAWMDDGGDIHYVARHDDMIISAGYNISPVQVETVLLRHEAVAECACVPAPDPSGRRGHVVKAFIVPADGTTGDDALKSGLQDWFKVNAPPYMYPREIAFLDALPKTINGKILRSELRRR